MKKIAASTLAVALWVGGARAQSPFFQPSAPAVQPVAASATTPYAPQLPPGGVVPVRVHFGGALTRDGVVPVPVYLNQPAGPMTYAPATPVQPYDTSRNLRQVSGAGDGAAKDSKAGATVITDENCAPEVTDPRFVAPHADDLHRPQRAPCGYRWYTSAEYLHYLYARPQSSPTLLFVGDTAVAASDVDVRDRQGARFTVGRWLETPNRLWAVEGVISFTGQRQARSAFSSNGVTPLLHEFIDQASGVPDSLAVAIDAPDLAPRSGSSEIEVSNRMFNFEANLRRELCRSSHGHLDMLIGYRQFHLDEGIVIRDRVVYDTAPVPLSDATVTSFDSFGTHNRLHAGQIGLEGELNWRRFYIDGWGKFALGGNDEVINISGATHVRPTPGRTPPPAPLNGKDFVGALYTQPSNIGRYHDSQLTVMPEVGVTVGFNLTPNLRFGGGYNFLFLNNVVRPGDAIDTTVSRNQIPQLQPLAQTAGSRPAAPQFIESSYWAHGITVQMEFRY